MSFLRDLPKPAGRREIYTESLSDESFRQGTAYSLVISRFFN